MRILNAAIMIWLAVAGAAGADGAEEGIIVNGEGVVTAVPDMATITLGVRETAPTADGAVSRVGEAVAAILDELAWGGEYRPADQPVFPAAHP